MQGRDGPEPTGDVFSYCVIRAWNLMRGEVNWSAIDAVAELIGIDDIEGLIRGLDVIATHQQKIRAAEAEMLSKHR